MTIAQVINSLPTMSYAEAHALAIAVLIANDHREEVLKRGGETAISGLNKLMEGQGQQ